MVKTIVAAANGLVTAVPELLSPLLGFVDFTIPFGFLQPQFFDDAFFALAAGKRKYDKGILGGDPSEVFQQLLESQGEIGLLHRVVPLVKGCVQREEIFLVFGVESEVLIFFVAILTPSGFGAEARRNTASVFQFGQNTPAGTDGVQNTTQFLVMKPQGLRIFLLRHGVTEEIERKVPQVAEVDVLKLGVSERVIANGVNNEGSQDHPFRAWQAIKRFKIVIKIT